jgi:hypothetical protein
MTNSPETSDLISSRLQISAARAIVDDNLRPVHRQLNRTPFADSSASTGDECNFVMKFHDTS